MTGAERFLRDPDTAFEEPSELLGRSDLSISEKLRILRSWHADLVELQTATEENMSDETDHLPGEVAARLTEVATAITQLENER